MATQIAHAFNGVCISQRAEDGYLNATAMCKANDKQFNDYARLSSVSAFLQELSAKTGIPVLGLVQSKKGGSNPGTWIHPQVAIHFAQWCSPQFAVFVTQLVFDWMTGNIPVPATAPKNIQPNPGEVKLKDVKTHVATATLSREEAIDRVSSLLAHLHDEGVLITEIAERAKQKLGAQKKQGTPENVVKVAARISSHNPTGHATLERVKKIAKALGGEYYSIVLCNDHGPIILDDGSLAETHPEHVDPAIAREHAFKNARRKTAAKPLTSSVVDEFLGLPGISL